MNISKERLREKGWSEEEIKHTHNILSKAKRKKHPHHHLLEEAVFWGVLLISVFTVIATTWWLLPILILAGASVSYPILAIIGLSFGMLLYIIIKDLDHLQTHHHKILSFALPISSMIGFISILSRASKLLHAQTSTNTLVIGGAIFTLALLAPYIYHRLQEK